MNRKEPQPLHIITEGRNPSVANTVLTPRPAPPPAPPAPPAPPVAKKE